MATHSISPNDVWSGTNHFQVRLIQMGEGVSLRAELIKLPSLPGWRAILSMIEERRSPMDQARIPERTTVWRSPIANSMEEARTWANATVEEMLPVIRLGGVPIPVELP